MNPADARAELVSTHSRLKAAAGIVGFAYATRAFQHTAA